MSVAAKVISITETPPLNKSKFIQKILLHRKVCHPNVVDFMGLCISEHKVAIVTSIVGKFNLRDILGSPFHKLIQLDKISIARQIAQGMEYLHSKEPPIIHTGLNPAKILIHDGYPYKIKVCGFIFTNILDIENKTTKVCTPEYLAPEIIQKMPYGLKADVYSFGVVMWEIETRLKPYRSVTSEELNSKVVGGLRPEIPSTNSSVLLHLCQKAWNPNPDASHTSKIS